MQYVQGLDENDKCHFCARMMGLIFEKPMRWRRRGHFGHFGHQFNSFWLLLLGLLKSNVYKIKPENHPRTDK